MSVLVFVPMYNCAAQIPRVLAQLRDPDISRLVDAVVCVDNGSSDDTVEAAKQAMEQVPLRKRAILRNDDNYGLGGSHKVAIEYARSEGYEFLVVLHGDDQGDIADLKPHLRDGAHHEVDFLMGARFMRGSVLQGYSTLRVIANRFFNRLFSIVVGRRLYDLGSGLNLFRVAAFDDHFHHRFADGLTFNYYLIIAIADRAIADRQFRLRFFPLSWREDDQVSNARLSRMGVQILALLWRRLSNKQQFAHAEHRTVARSEYTYKVACEWTEASQ